MQGRLTKESEVGEVLLTSSCWYPTQRLMEVFPTAQSVVLLHPHEEGRMGYEFLILVIYQLIFSLFPGKFPPSYQKVIYLSYWIQFDENYRILCLILMSYIYSLRQHLKPVCHFFTENFFHFMKIPRTLIDSPSVGIKKLSHTSSVSINNDSSDFFFLRSSKGMFLSMLYIFF